MDANALVEAVGTVPGHLNDLQKELVDLAVEIGEELPFTQAMLTALKAKRQSLKGGLVCEVLDKLKVPQTPKPIALKNSGYPDFVLRPREKQIASLIKWLPHLSPDVADVPLCDEADGIFAIPNPKALGGSWAQAVKAFFNIFRDYKFRGGKFWSSRYDQIDDQHVRPMAKTEQAFQILSQQQEHRDILMVSCQLGKKFKGVQQSSALASMGEHEFGLGSLGNFSILLTNASRLGHKEDLGIDASGDEPVGKHKHHPVFFWDAQGFLVYACREDSANSHFGTPSGFIPVS